MSEVRKSATAYLNGTHKEEKMSNSLAAKLARYSDPFISSNGELCVNVRAYERVKKIFGRHIKRPGIILNLESPEDVDTMIEYLQELREHPELLRAVAQKRRDEWERKRR